ncbi:MAG: SH3 domain-containing protein [Verrucomicrobia subdivision 3 bacterium]|nr:SH3 domain-containing protein [Limisphaerales bacterium]
MKTTYWWMLAASLSLAAPTAPADDQLPKSTPAKDDAKKPATTPEAKPAATTAVPSLAGDPITGPGPAIVSQRNVNVRGKPAINSEVLVRLNRGDRVNVLEEVTLSKPKANEPAKWAKVSLPTNAAVWAHASFIDPTQNTVKPRRLNLRSGPGENYSIIGRIERGAVVKPIDTKGDWVKLDPPAEAYGFIAAHLLAREPAAPVIAAAPTATPGTPAQPAPPPIETPVVTTPAPAPAEPVVATPAAPTAATPAPPPVIETPTPEPAVTPTPVPSEPEETLVKRIVTREGIVERSVSIQAPTYFILQSLENRRAINYLYSPATNVVLRDYFGQRIIVTGEESLDERWPNMPVIEVEKIEAVP